jgi:hypothetical protein
MNISEIITGNMVHFFCEPEKKEDYDLTDACPVCGAGAQRISPLIMQPSRLKNKVSRTYGFEIIIPPRLVAEIRKIAPQCLRKIVNRKGEDTSFCELIPEITMPRWEESTSGWCYGGKLEPQCSHCKRDGYFGIPHVTSNLVYADIPEKFSVAATYERFSKAHLNPDFRGSRFGFPILLVNENIKNILIKEKDLEFVPVKILNQNPRANH